MKSSISEKKKKKKKKKKIYIYIYIYKVLRQGKRIDERYIYIVHNIIIIFKISLEQVQVRLGKTRFIILL